MSSSIERRRSLPNFTLPTPARLLPLPPGSRKPVSLDPISGECARFLAQRDGGGLPGEPLGHVDLREESLAIDEGRGRVKTGSKCKLRRPGLN